MAAFEQMRVSLGRPEMPPLMVQSGHEEKVRERRSYLEGAFAEGFDFLHQGRKFSFLPTDSLDGFVAGFFGREISEDSHAGPETHFSPVRLTHWDLAFFVLDLRPTSQIAFMQNNSKVGSPRPILESFFEALTQKEQYRDWQPYVQFISDTNTFWEVAERFKGKITRLSFTFIPPNALRSEERVMDFIRDAAEHANAQIVKHEYENRAGKLDPDSDLVRGSVEVATKGGGEAAIKVKSRTVYSTASRKTVIDVPSEEVPEPDDKPGVFSLIRRLFETFSV